MEIILLAHCRSALSVIQETGPRYLVFGEGLFRCQTYSAHHVVIALCVQQFINVAARARTHSMKEPVELVRAPRQDVIPRTFPEDFSDIVRTQFLLSHACTFV